LQKGSKDEILHVVSQDNQPATTKQSNGVHLLVRLHPSDPSLLWFENKDNQTKHLKIAKTKSFCFLSNERTATTTSTKTKDVNQFLSFLGTDRGKIPIELNYPSKIINALNSIVPEKSTSIISSITINIFACIFSKQTSKNVLVVNSSLLRLFENQSNSNKSNNSITSTSSWLLRLKKSKHHRVSSGGNGGNGEVVAFASHSLCKQKETIYSLLQGLLLLGLFAKQKK
jgi:hypothetical protein